MIWAIVLASLTATAAAHPPSAEVGEEIEIEVAASGGGFSGAATVSAGKLPDGVDVGAVQGPKLERQIQIVNRVQTQTERLIWVFPVTATRAGTFTIPGFTVTAGNESATTAPIAIRATGDFDSHKYAFVDTAVDPRPHYVGEPIEVTVTAGIHDDWIDRLVRDETSLGAPWLADGLGPGCFPEAAVAPPGAVSMRNGTGQVEMVPGQTERKEGRFDTWTVTRRFVASRPGTVTVGSTQFRAVIATKTEKDPIFGGHLYATQTKLASVSAPAIAIEVRPLPEAGRPDDFTGLVGTLSLSVDAEPRNVKVGESIRVRVTVAGEGNLEGQPLPRVEPDGFKRFGVAEEVAPDGASRTLVYDLAPISPEVTAIPPFHIPYFDAQAGKYAVLESKPIRIQVQPGAAVSALSEPAVTPAPAAMIADTPAPVPMPSPLRVAVIAGALALPLATGALLLARRRRTPAVEPRRRARARKVFQAALAAVPGSHDQACLAVSRALVHYLADLAEQPRETFLGTDLSRALEPWVADAALRARVERLIAGADRGAFAHDRGVDPRALAQEALALAGPLDASFPE